MSVRNRLVGALGRSDRLKEIIGRLYHAVSDDAVPGGHYYSPVPSLTDVRNRDAEIFEQADLADLPGVDLRDADQLELLALLGDAFRDHPWGAEARGMRYTFDNTYFGRFDALALHAILRHLRPSRLIEIGSGYSSAAILDTNDLHLDGRMACTFIEPYPERLRGLLRDDDDQSMIRACALQEIDSEMFGELRAGDVLFIDSSHVSKIGSDVNREILSILPSLAPGVWIHIHDIFYPFEYPREWVFKGRYWNEAYLLRAFLAFNQSFCIRFWNSYLAKVHPEALFGLLPELKGRPAGGSIWLERLPEG